MTQQRTLVMLIDDDLEDAFLLRKAFAASRAAVDFTHLLGGDDLKAFLATAPVAKASNPPPSPLKLPDVILLDINMPAADGFQVLRHLRAEDATKAIPVIMFTTSKLDDDVETAYRHGANGYFVKPSSIGELIHFAENLHEYCL